MTQPVVAPALLPPCSCLTNYRVAVLEWDAAAQTARSSSQRTFTTSDFAFTVSQLRAGGCCGRLAQRSPAGAQRLAASWLALGLPAGGREGVTTAPPCLPGVLQG